MTSSWNGHSQYDRGSHSNCGFSPFLHSITPLTAYFSEPLHPLHADGPHAECFPERSWTHGTHTHKWVCRLRPRCIRPSMDAPRSRDHRSQTDTATRWMR